MNRLKVQTVGGALRLGDSDDDTSFGSEDSGEEVVSLYNELSSPSSHRQRQQQRSSAFSSDKFSIANVTGHYPTLFKQAEKAASSSKNHNRRSWTSSESTEDETDELDEIFVGPGSGYSYNPFYDGFAYDDGIDDTEPNHEIEDPDVLLAVLGDSRDTNGESSRGRTRDRTIDGVDARDANETDESERSAPRKPSSKRASVVSLETVVEHESEGASVKHDTSLHSMVEGITLQRRSSSRSFSQSRYANSRYSSLVPESKSFTQLVAEFQNSSNKTRSRAERPAMVHAGVSTEDRQENELPALPPGQLVSRSVQTSPRLYDEYLQKTKRRSALHAAERQAKAMSISTSELRTLVSSGHFYRYDEKPLPSEPVSAVSTPHDKHMVQHDASTSPIKPSSSKHLRSISVVPHSNISLSPPASPTRHGLGIREHDERPQSGMGHSDSHATFSSETTNRSDSTRTFFSDNSTRSDSTRTFITSTDYSFQSISELDEITPPAVPAKDYSPSSQEFSARITPPMEQQHQKQRSAHKHTSSQKTVADIALTRAKREERLGKLQQEIDELDRKAKRIRNSIADIQKKLGSRDLAWNRKRRKELEQECQQLRNSLDAIEKKKYEKGILLSRQYQRRNQEGFGAEFWVRSVSA